MTVAQAIEKINYLRDNAVDESVKAGFIIRLEQRMRKEILGEDVSLSYPEDENETLMLPERYCDVYIHYLAAMLSFYAKEYDEYNNETEVFNNAYDEYKREYIAENLPARKNFRGHF